MLRTKDKQDHHLLMRQILEKNAVLLDVPDELANIGQWEINFDDCTVYLKNIIEDSGELSTLPWMVYQLNTFDGEVVEVPMRRVLPDDDIFSLWSDVVGDFELWW